MGVGVQCVPLGGLVSSVLYSEYCTCITFKLHSMYYSYTFNVLLVQLSLQCLQHVYYLKLFNVLCVHVLCVQLSL